MKRYREVTLIMAALLFASPVHPTAQRGQPTTLPSMPACRHDDRESPEDKRRREQAFELVRSINQMEAESFSKTSRYLAKSELQVGALPSGFVLNVLADKTGFIVAMKDRLDPCRFGIFSDEEGIVYGSTPRLPQMAGASQRQDN